MVRGVAMVSGQIWILKDCDWELYDKPGLEAMRLRGGPAWKLGYAVQGSLRDGDKIRATNQYVVAFVGPRRSLPANLL